MSLSIKNQNERNNKLNKMYENIMAFYNFIYDFCEYHIDEGNLSIKIIDLKNVENILKNMDECKQDLIEIYIVRSISYWDKIFEQNIEFVQKNILIIFGDGLQKYSNPIGSLFQRGLVEDEDIDFIWSVFKGMTSLSVSYLHYSCDPNTNGKYNKLNYKIKTLLGNKNIYSKNIPIYIKKYKNKI